ncbi:MAG: SAM hydroxide adenosyltransferase [Candidatus Acidiferrum sp.]
MGDEIQDFKRFALPRPKSVDAGIKGVVLRIDPFGNLVTNFRLEDLPGEAKNGAGLKLHVGAHTVARLVDTFAHGKTGEPIAYIGSSGYLEIALNKGNASRTLSVGRGAAVVLSKK